MAKAKCSATTKAGKPCSNAPIAETEFCISHSPKAVQTKAGFGGRENAAKGGAAKRIPTLSEKLREKVEARADEIIDKLLEGLEAERSVVVGNGPSAFVESVPDRDGVLKTIREIFDRTEGRPKQSTEISGEVNLRSRDQLVREVERLTEQLAEAKLNGDRDRATA